ncbi:MAG: methyltransferase domain-containing protein [Coriobacteriia bacterium]|nr:methyltransferase domain-containing protein [Coriobacteriia bacterium]
MIRTLGELLAWEADADRAFCGVDLAEQQVTRFKQLGANDPTPTHYFVLDQLFPHFELDERSHVLDVGCGAGRVLAYFLREGLPGRITGVELDPQLAAVARAWTEPHPNVEVLQGSVLDLDFSPYTGFYLFNPFKAGVLRRFVRAVEARAKRPVTVVHMSDNGDTWWYVGRDGWTELASGKIQHLRNERGVAVKVFEQPQHYTVWRFEPAS